MKPRQLLPSFSAPSRLRVTTSSHRKLNGLTTVTGQIDVRNFAPTETA